MQHTIALILLFCVLALGVQGQFSDTDFEEIEAEYYNPPATTRPPRTTTTRRPLTPKPWFTSTTRRPPSTTTRRPITSPIPSTTVRPTNPGIDGNGQLIGCPCRSTQESNSVCGTDGNTYGNLAKLKCAQKCGHLVEVNFLGGCRGRS